MKWKNWRNIWHDSNVYSKESLILDLNMFGIGFLRNTNDFSVSCCQIIMNSLQGEAKHSLFLVEKKPNAI